jgi:hypothetical protein
MVTNRTEDLLSSISPPKNHLLALCVSLRKQVDEIGQEPVTFLVKFPYFGKLPSRRIQHVIQN